MDTGVWISDYGTPCIYLSILDMKECQWQKFNTNLQGIQFFSDLHYSRRRELNIVNMHFIKCALVNLYTFRE